MWECTAGTFRWYFGWDETVVIQEGAVEVTGEDGERRLLTAVTSPISRVEPGRRAHRALCAQDRLLRKPFPEPTGNALPAAQCVACGAETRPLANTKQSQNASLKCWGQRPGKTTRCRSDGKPVGIAASG